MTTPQGMLELADELERARDEHLNSFGQSPSVVATKRDEVRQILHNDVSAIIAALRQAAAPQGREAEAQIDALNSLSSTEEADINFLLGQLGLGFGTVSERNIVRSFRKQLIQIAALTPAVAPDGAGD